MRDVCTGATPKTILRLAARSRKLFTPSPYLVVAATGRQLGEWARRSEENESTLNEAFDKGIDGVTDLCIEHCGLRLEDLPRLLQLRSELIDFTVPLVEEWIEWNEVDWVSLHAEPMIALMHVVIYCELFGTDMDIFLGLENDGKRALKPETRLEFIANCVNEVSTPDQVRRWNPTEGAQWFYRDDDPCDAGIFDNPNTYQDLTPYERDIDEPYGQYQSFLSTMLDTRSTLVPWHEAWSKVRLSAGPDFVPIQVDEQDDNHVIAYAEYPPQDWRQIWGTEEWKGALTTWREKIAAMQREPRRIPIGSVPMYNHGNGAGAGLPPYVTNGYTYECPWLAADLEWALRCRKEPWAKEEVDDRTRGSGRFFRG
ncbi:hypothetical protein EJ08DRAFT_691311 [Tothia fuscella]|uniref:Uncharacterized protein n=1 Tax=Tothia fuscella TaxID=1048955 RepID=A0A9P4P5L0_9PEZI|nr:hypothetical protein EJ08DRAFT_691311 [Tothia fuscella]